ncbi:MAG TPA: MarR family winged helix-turn-helix transcriptional regulator [Xylella fastidiosa subsp. multiplex]
MSEPNTASHTIHINLEQFLPFRISMLSKHINDNIAKIYEHRYNIAATEWHVITILALYPGSSASKVSEHSAMDKVAVSRAVARLLKHHFIQRENHGDDRRRSMLTLSPIGNQVYETVAPLINDMKNRLMSVLSEKERQLLDHLIDRLIKEGLPRMILKD